MIDNLSSFFAWRCQQQPSSLAYAFIRDTLDVAQSLTYAELDAQVRILAAEIVHHSQPGDRVLLVYPPGLEFVRAFWACMLTGRVAVPVPAPDPLRFKNNAPRLRAIIVDAQASLVLTTTEFLEPAQSFDSDAGGTGARWLATDAAALPLHDREAASVALGPDSVAYLQYTSGSTSAPRGVIVTHAHLLAQCQSDAWQLRAGASRLLSWLPHFHDYGLVFGMLMPFHAGVPSYLMSPLSFLRRPLRWLEAMARYGATHTGAPNFAYMACVKALEQQPHWRADLRNLRSCSCGAEPIHPDAAAQFHAAFRAHGLGDAVFAPAYGMAETVLVVTATPPGVPPAILSLNAQSMEQGIVAEGVEGAIAVRRVVGCGSPIPQMSVRIVDPQTFAPSAPDRVGEIWVQGSSVGQGYWRRESLSAEIFQARTVDGDGPYLRTGDLGFMHQGQLFVSGRLKDLIIVHGRNHAPQDIEWTVQRSNPVLRAGYGAAFSIDSDDAEALVIVQEVERSAVDADLAQIVRTIRRVVAEEHDLPVHAVALIRAGTVPRTTSGKIRRQSCKQEYLEGKLQTLLLDVTQAQNVESDPAVEFPADLRAQTDAAVRLAAIQQTLLRLVARFARRDSREIGLDASAIECGLDSLSTFRLLQAIESSLGFALPTSSVLGEPSLRAVAALIGTLLARPVPAALALHSASSERSAQPLSAAQQRMWFWQEMAPDTALYNVPLALALHGPLDAAALQDCLRDLMQRHPILCSRWVRVDGQTLQRIEAAADWRIKQVDVQGADAALALALYEQLAADEGYRALDPAREAPMRATLVRLAEHEHRLLWTLHHSVCDGWSIDLLLDELGELYSARVARRTAQLSPPGLSYLDYARWEPQWLAHGVRARELAYWTHKLAGVPVSLDLPADRRRSAVQRFRGASLRLTLTAVQLSALRELALRTGSTLFMTLLASWQILMHRYSGQSTIVTGSVVANRERRDLAGVVGYFANTLALRSDFGESLTVVDLLSQVKANALGAIDHQHLPFEEVVDALKLPRDTSRMPLIQTMVVLQAPAQPLPKWGQASVERVALASPMAKFDLTLELQEQGEALGGHITYDTDLFDAATAERLVGHWLMLIQGMCTDASQTVATLALLSGPERERILASAHGDANADTRFVPLQRCFEQHAQRAPSAVAALFDERRASYQQLNAQANRLAHALRGLGVGPEVRVGVCMDRSLELVAALLGVLKAGGAFVPMDPELPRDRLEYQLRDTAAPVLLTQSHLLAQLPQAGSGALRHVLCLDENAGLLAEGNASDPDWESSPHDLAYVIYTSGSTGRPKGVLIEHAAMNNSSRWMCERLALRPADRVLAASSISFDASVVELLHPLRAGASIVLARAGAQRDPQALAQLMRQQGITILVMVPSALRALLNEASFAPARLRFLISAGEALDQTLACALQVRLPDTTIGNFYGPTEASIVATHCEWPIDCAGSPQVPIGRPITNAHCLVLDAHLQPVPIGVVGELYIGGAGLARGYLNQPELSAARFIVHPFTAGQRLYRSGDLARYRSDANIEYLGRIDSQVKIRGFRIELGEIEAALAAIDAIRQAVVVAREDRPGDMRLVAYVVGSGIDVQDLRRRLRTTLPQSMVPAAFVELAELPTLTNGKIDRQALPAPEYEVDRAEVVAPRSESERTIWEIWRDVLQVRQFGVTDNFFDLGGHSLLATQVRARVLDSLGVELPMRALFEAATIAGQAAAVEHSLSTATPNRAAAWPNIERQPRDRLLPTSYAQRRMWLIQQLNPKTAAYNMPFALRLRGALHRDALIAALQHLIARHEVFRTTLVAVDGEPMQRIAPTLGVRVEFIDLCTLAKAERLGAARSALRQRAQLPYDLATGPLHRMTLLQLGDQEHVLFWSIHHSICDGWSLTILLRELADVYAALVRGAEPTLPPKALEFADYAAWQRRVFSGEVLERQLAHWRKTLEGLAPLPLPADRPRRAAHDGRGSSTSQTIAPHTMAGIKALAVQQGVTPFMALLACFQLLLARYCGVDDVAVGTPIANRTQRAAEPLVGMLVNTVVMRTDLGGNPSFLELLQRVRETALQAYAHQDLPFEALVEALAVARSDASAPLVQVLFNVLSPPAAPNRFEGLDHERFDFDSGTSQFDLALNIDTEMFGQAWLSFSIELFDASTGARLLASYLRLLEQVVATPAASIASFDLVGGEARQLLQGWNSTARPGPSAQTIHALIEQQARRSLDRVGLRSSSGSLNYAELQRRSNQLARLLRSRGIGRGALVGLCVERSLDMIVAQLAILKAGAAYLPLDPAYPPERLRTMCDDAQLALLVTESGVRTPYWPHHKCLLLDMYTAAIAAQSSAALDADARFDAGATDPAYVIYTSGSTGKPKGVVVPHRAAVNFLASMAHQPGLQASDVLLAVTTLSFDIAVLELLLPLTVGAQIILASLTEAADGKALRGLLESGGVSVMQATPSTWRLLIDAGWRGGPSFKALIGGEGLPIDLAQQLLARCGELWNMYGPTETTVWSSCWRVVQPEQGISIGRPIANTQIHVLDEQRRPCPIGVTGEICIGGEGVALGYLNRPELTAERFVADPFCPGARLYRTGDRGRWRHDGRLEHLGRLDHQVKVRGHRIELGEIEAHLSTHPAVAHSVVIVREDRPGDVRLVAYVVLRYKAPPSAALREHLRATLPEYMLPQHFVAIGAVPLLPNGKMNRQALPAPVETQVDDPVTDAPQTPLEQGVAQIWQELLGVSQVGLRDNFFDLGGHSLLAMRAIAAIESQLGLKLNARRMVFESLGQLTAEADIPVETQY